MSKKKIRRARKKKYTCFTCGPDKQFYKSELKNRSKVPYCVDHIEEYDKKNTPQWPLCPKCKSETEFGTMEWNGSVDDTIASCDDCGFTCKALDHFEYFTVKIIASPIDYRHVSASVGYTGGST